MNKYKGLAIASCKRFFPHLLTRNMEENVMDIAQTAWVIAHTERVDSVRAVNRACREVARALGYRRDKSEAAKPLVFDVEADRRVILRPDGDYRRKIDNTIKGQRLKKLRAKAA